MAQVDDKFLACGVLEHGFARTRCDDCAHEYLLAFSCTCLYFCPSCHAKRLAIGTQWLDSMLLAPVPHRQVVLTTPKRRRAHCLSRRRLLGEIAGVVAIVTQRSVIDQILKHLRSRATTDPDRPAGSALVGPATPPSRVTARVRRNGREAINRASNCVAVDS